MKLKHLRVFGNRNILYKNSFTVKTYELSFIFVEEKKTNCNVTNKQLVVINSRNTLHFHDFYLYRWKLPINTILFTG